MREEDDDDELQRRGGELRKGLANATRSADFEAPPVSRLPPKRPSIQALGGGGYPLLGRQPSVDRGGHPSRSSLTASMHNVHINRRRVSTNSDIAPYVPRRRISEATTTTATANYVEASAKPVAAGPTAGSTILEMAVRRGGIFQASPSASLHVDGRGERETGDEPPWYDDYRARIASVVSIGGRSLTSGADDAQHEDGRGGIRRSGPSSHVVVASRQSPHHHDRGRRVRGRLPPSHQAANVLPAEAGAVRCRGSQAVEPC